MRCFITATLLMAAASPAPAQNVGDRRFDPVSGDYFVWLMDDSRQLLEMRVIPPNKVLASVVAKVEPGAAHRLRYTYRVKVLPGTRQPLIFVDIDCPASAAYDSLTAVTVHNGVRGSWSIGLIGDDPMESPLDQCSIMSRREPLPAGGTLTVGLETTLLPVIGEVRLFGRTGGFSWPTSDPIEENEPAAKAVDEVDGSNGGWKSIPAPVPGRDPSSITTLEAGLSVLHGDLGRACGDLGWISSTEVCARLKSRLHQASPAMTRGKHSLVQLQLHGFLKELAAAHNREGGATVNEAAFGLLTVIAEYILSRASF